jgi:glycosyltransferase involved in cell wall biosynthesis
MQSKKISAVINTCNEAHLLDDCVVSLRPFVDEIVVCDMESEDGSAELAKKLDCVVFSHPKRSAVEETIIPRVKKATGEWMLLFDPDMRLPKKTGKKLLEIAANDEADAVECYIRNQLFGRFCNYGHASRDFVLKFFKKDAFLRSGEPKVKIHAMVVDALRGCHLIRLSKRFYIEHIAYTDVYKCFEQHLRYAKYEAKELWNEGIRFSYRRLLLLTIRKFVGDFVVRQAWRSGMPGLIYSGAAWLGILHRELFLWEKTCKTNSEKGK